MARTYIPTYMPGNSHASVRVSLETALPMYRTQRSMNEPSRMVTRYEAIFNWFVEKMQQSGNDHFVSRGCSVRLNNDKNNLLIYLPFLLEHKIRNRKKRYNSCTFDLVILVRTTVYRIERYTYVCVQKKIITNYFFKSLQLILILYNRYNFIISTSTFYNVDIRRKR